MALAPFPADDPIWNTNGTNRTTPTTTKQGIGWALNEAPPSSFFNWWMFYVSEYVQHYKTAVVALDTGKANRNGDDQLSGDFSPSVDGGATLGQGRPFLRVRTHQLSVDLIGPLGDEPSSIGQPGSPYGQGYFSDLFAATKVAAPIGTFSSAVNVPVVNASVLNAATVSATTSVSTLEVITGQGGHQTKRGIREFDVNRALAVIEKPAGVVFSFATHVVKASNISGAVATGGQLRFTMTNAMADVNYGVTPVFCRGAAVSDSDLVLCQVLNKTTTTFDVRFWYWSGTAWTQLILDTTNGLAKISGSVTVQGNEA